MAVSSFDVVGWLPWVGCVVSSAVPFRSINVALSQQCRQVGAKLQINHKISYQFLSWKFS